MPWTPVHFRKHEGKTLPQILWNDPDWFYWAIENHVFEDKPNLQQEAKILYAKSRSIKVPQTGPTTRGVQYNYHQGKMAGFRVIPEDCAVEKLPTHIDLYLVRESHEYDKRGYKMFLKNLKYVCLGDADMKMTKERCEDFYDDASRFLVNS
jgi:hypothetical protein